MKSDKELAVELAEAYISAWFARTQTIKPLDGVDLRNLVNDAYTAIHSLPEGK
jgi:hypothetical protein